MDPGNCACLTYCRGAGYDLSLGVKLPVCPGCRRHHKFRMT